MSRCPSILTVVTKMAFDCLEVIQLLAALVAGGLIGAERELRDKAAGFRTMIFISVGATLFTLLSVRLGSPYEPSRVAASIVSGVGFLGAGAILRAQGRIVGLTTASTIWLVAALGMAIGGGYFALAASGTLLTLVVLLAFPRIESWMDSIWEVRSYTVACEIGSEVSTTLPDALADSGLRILRSTRSKRGSQIVYHFHVSGSPSLHRQFTDRLIADQGVSQLDT